VAAVTSELQLSDDYRAQEQIVSQATARAEQAEIKAAQAETDREEKGKPYRDDPKFMYLWQRRYLTPDYAGSGIIRMLDGWVAKLIRYADARSNYFLLTELPLRLRQHAERQARIAEAELAKIRALEAEAMQDEDLVKKNNTLQAAQKSLEEMDARIEAEEKQLETRLQQRSDYSNSRDEYSQQALQLQVSELKNESLANLHTTALKTPNPDDDVSVSRLRDLQREKKRLTDEIGRIREEDSRRQKQLHELDELRRKFRRRNYDSHHSHFPGGFELALLLGRLLAGSMSGGGVWDQIRRHQRFKRPRAPKDFGGGIFPGGFGGRRRGGRFGGGFGGGGGFKTGGGF
jgi:DNA repair exonuclease SbcCD ATPase subunit